MEHRSVFETCLGILGRRLRRASRSLKAAATGLRQDAVVMSRQAAYLCGARAGGWLFLCAVLTGCASYRPEDLVLGPSYRPENVFVWSPALPTTVKRVALLPLVAKGSDVDLAEGREALEPVLRAELAKTRKFELVCPSQEALRTHTGQRSWSGEEPLPPDLLAWLQATYGCDAILFSQLTVFRAYAPLAVGWRLRLVDLRTRATLWAADEVFDAGRPSVRAGARRYQLAELHTATSSDEWSIGHSPRQFGQYAAAELLATLPKP